MVKTNEIKRSYYLNLFSSSAEKVLNGDGSKNVSFRWNIRDLQLGSVAEIGLVQLINTNASSTTGYCFRILETYADGYDSYNQTSAIVYMGIGLLQPDIQTYHKIISNNLNTITIVATDDFSSSSTVYGGINTNITFGLILHVIDYLDLQNTY
jgi:hypothetical protein